ncbi:hypothetical protein [Echinicola salinicaeni]|uniref:hypothetical protein n=1 Tax=Echinicola salinicaeni TaxID=2762757 RepID=UPI0016471672|nr:hypothetical protein [Echinicola salinicaeni]
MKLINVCTVLFGMSVIFLSCGPRSAEQVDEGRQEQSFHLEIVDSIRLDYLGMLRVTDVHDKTGEIVGFNFKTNELVIFEKSGKIHQLYSKGGDQPHPISSVVSLGFYKEDKLLAASNYGDLAVFEKDGRHVGDIPLPFKIEFYNWTQRKKIYSVSDDMLLGQISGGRSEAYREYYLDFIDLKNGSLSPTLPIPEKSKYKNGQYYGSVYPFITMEGDFIYMLLRNEPLLHVYKREGMNIRYLKSIDFGGEDFTEVLPSEDQESFQWEENYDKMRPGEVRSVFDVGENLIVSYKNGVNASLYSEEIKSDPLRQDEVDPLYIAVFDTDQKLLSRRVRVPSKVDFIQEVMPDGAILASKNKEMFDKEDDFETFYLLELVED